MPNLITAEKGFVENRVSNADKVKEAIAVGQISIGVEKEGWTESIEFQSIGVAKAEMRI